MRFYKFAAQHYVLSLHQAWATVISCPPFFKKKKAFSWRLRCWDIKKAEQIDLIQHNATLSEVCLLNAHICFFFFFLLPWNIRYHSYMFAIQEKRPNFVSGIFRPQKQNIFKCPLLGWVEHRWNMDALCFPFVLLNSETFQFRSTSISSNMDGTGSSFHNHFMKFLFNLSALPHVS